MILIVAEPVEIYADKFEVNAPLFAPYQGFAPQRPFVTVLAVTGPVIVSEVALEVPVDSNWFTATLHNRPSIMKRYIVLVGLAEKPVRVGVQLYQRGCPTGQFSELHAESVMAALAIA